MDVNKGAVKLYGYEREELIGQSPVLLSDEDQSDITLMQ
jgi:PAS domain S-box-containing protein